MPTVDRIVDWALQNPPAKLFRYQPQKLSRAEMFLVRNKLYATSPVHFEDPLDTIVPMDTSGTRKEWSVRLNQLIEDHEPDMTSAERQQRIAEAIDSNLHIEMEEQSKQALRDQTGIVCFTHQENSPFMWEHYADRGKGFCVCFTYSQTDSVLGKAIPVQYLPQHPAYRYVDVRVQDVIVELMVTKLMKWEHEQEWRLIYLNKPDSRQSFTPQSLTSIVFGWKASKGFIRQCRKMIRKRKAPVKMYRAVLNKNSKGTHLVPL